MRGSVGLSCQVGLNHDTWADLEEKLLFLKLVLSSQLLVYANRPVQIDG